jgi:hypothetical protein
MVSNLHQQLLQLRLHLEQLAVEMLAKKNQSSMLS